MRPWALALLALFLGCGRAAKPAAWIGDRAAVIRCTGAGPLRMPPVLLGLPVPQVPTGLLAHALDPSSLDGLGYERDATACAVLEAPSADSIDKAKTTLPALVEAYDAVSREALRAGGRCTCEIARELGERDLVAACLQTPTISGCDVEAKATEVARALDPLREALASAELPWIHWRLVGATDRPGWFAAHLPDLLERHIGGSTAYVRGEALPARTEPLVRDLLALENVVAVVRQDSGRAILVARERDGLLVLDHFAQPPMLARLGPLVKRLEQRRSVALVSLLTPSVGTQAPMGRPEDGNFVELDRAMLEELDRAAIAASALLGAPYEPNAAVYLGQPVLVDRVLLQAPFGVDGQRLVVRARLSTEGIAWAQTLGGAALAPNIDALGLSDQSPKYTPPPNSDVELLLRGSETETILVHGLSRMPTLMRAIEEAHPGALGGSLSHWKIELEGGDPAPTLVGPSLAKLREQIAAGKYELEMNLADSNTILELDLRPQ